MHRKKSFIGRHLSVHNSSNLTNETQSQLIEAKLVGRLSIIIAIVKLINKKQQSEIEDSDSILYRKMFVMKLSKKLFLVRSSFLVLRNIFTIFLF